MKNAKKPHSYIFVRRHICQVGKSKSDTFFGDFQLYNSTISTVGSCTVVAYRGMGAVWESKVFSKLVTYWPQIQGGAS